MLDHSIAVGLTDPDRVAITGYSQGGFLTAWGITRPNNTFKAAVVGGGVSDWGMLAAFSALPDVEATAIASDHSPAATDNRTGGASNTDCSRWRRPLDPRRTGIFVRKPNSLLPKRSHATLIAAR